MADVDNSSNSNSSGDSTDANKGDPLHGLEKHNTGSGSRILDLASRELHSVPQHKAVSAETRPEDAKSNTSADAKHVAGEEQGSEIAGQEGSEGSEENYVAYDGVEGNELLSVAAILPPESVEAMPFTTLDMAADASFFYKPLKIRCLVAGKGVAPYLVPRKVQIDVSHLKTRRQFDHVFTPWDSAILSLIDCTQERQKRVMRAALHIPAEADILVLIKDTMNIEEVQLIPAISHDTEQGPYTLRKAYYVGRGLETNRVYDFVGYTVPHPQNQAATHILVEAIPAETDVDNFILTPEIKEVLTRTFSIGEGGSVHSKLSDIAYAFSEHVTMIYGRADLHTAIDLVFHSVLCFDFNGSRVKKGWLECLILGDTRTGKGFVTEGLARYYGVGEVVSGENLSLAGLVGGVQHMGDRWTLVWGKLPLADKRLVIVDECGSLSHTDFGRLSRIRSEGVAEVTKIISERTTSRTRIIWIANPRPQPESLMPKMIASYTYGIEAVPELIGAAEDVARFDYALIIAQSEVNTEEINRDHTPSGESPYTSELCRQLIMWAWSRKPEQIIWAEGTVPLVLKAARALGSLFSPRVCLIQGEDVRFKVARIAAATAARVFSTDDGVNLIIRQEHIDFAYNFLYHIYSKSCSGYLLLSQQEKERTQLKDPEKVRNILNQVGEDHLLDLVNGLIDNRNITARDLTDYGNISSYQAGSMISELVRARAITKEYSTYIKSPSFKIYLEGLKRVLASATEAPTTTSDSDTDDSEGDTVS